MNAPILGWNRGFEKAVHPGEEQVREVDRRRDRTQVPVRHRRPPRVRIRSESLNTFSGSSDKSGGGGGRTNARGCRPVLGSQRGGQAMETQIHTEVDRVGGDRQEGTLIASCLLNLQIRPSHPPHHSFFSSSFSHSLQAHPIASAKRGSWAIWFDCTISLLVGRPLDLP